MEKTFYSNTFAVDDVEAATTPIWTETLAEHVGKRFKRNVLVLPQSGKAVINAAADFYLRPLPKRTPQQLKLGMVEQRRPEGERLERLMKNAIRRVHPLVDAVDTAFRDHRPLTLSPDSIWLTIEQGFAHHVAENAEALRHRLVRHEGKLTLREDIFDMSPASLEQAIAGFSSQIREKTDPVLHETLICDFSTTTPAIRTASEVVLMDCYASYFRYHMRCICGIPKITVTGSLDDWQRIRARIEVIETFGLGWWAACLRPIIDQFVETVSGRPNVQFWQAIYKPKRAYGSDSVTGWISDLFPYLGDTPGKRRQSHVFKFEREDWAMPIEQGVKTAGFDPGAEKGVSPSGFPSGLASVPVKLTGPISGAANEVDLVAGFLGVEQDPSDLALSPVIGWSMAESAPKVPVLVD